MFLDQKIHFFRHSKEIDEKLTIRGVAREGVNPYGQPDLKLINLF